MYIPSVIRDGLGDGDYQQDSIGMSGSQVLCFEDKVLKIGDGQELENEYGMMSYLTGKLPVPKVLAYVREQGTGYLLMSRIQGKMACDAEEMEKPDMLVKRLVEGLRMLWDLDIRDCPRVIHLEDRLREAEYRVNHGMIDMEDAEPDTFGEGGFQDPQELLDWLWKEKPEEELIFSHGDFCLPNLFIQDDHINGFIDLGNAGVSDRYQDLALCYRSLEHNYNGYYGGKVYEGFRSECLFETLGIEPDWEKIRYYILLDELF